jgi:hypothetical protein
MRLNAYLLLGDPSYLAASVRSYYDAVDRIVVSYDAEHSSWGGDQLPIEECLAELRAVDPAGKLDFRPGSFSDPTRHAMDCETSQRQTALAAAEHGADWVLQLDNDEVVPDLGSFVAKLQEADRAGASGIDYPSRWIYARANGGGYLEGSSRFWRPAAGFPGPLGVRAGTKLRHARQCDGSLFRVDFGTTNTDPWRNQSYPVDATVGVDSAVIHFSWVRSEDELRRKASVSGHRDYKGWSREIDAWKFRQRHALLAVALTPFRNRGEFHPGWLRRVRLPIEPSARVVSS